MNRLVYFFKMPAGGGGLARNNFVSRGQQSDKFELEFQGCQLGLRHKCG